MIIHNSHKLASLFVFFSPFLFIIFFILWMNDIRWPISSLFPFFPFESVDHVLYWIILFDHFVLQHYNFYLSFLLLLLLLSMETRLESESPGEGLGFGSVSGSGTWVQGAGPGTWVCTGSLHPTSLGADQVPGTLGGKPGYRVFRGQHGV